MGGAFVALADDINSLEYNPAGLALLQPDYFDAAFQHVFWFAGVEYETLAYAQNLGDTYGVGLQILYRHMPDIDNTLEDETPLKVWDAAVRLGYGMLITNVAVGANLKFFMTHLGTEDLTGQALDLGAWLPFLENKMSAGLSIQNIGPSVKDDPLPMLIRVGVAYRDAYGEEKEHQLNSALELFQPLDYALNLQLGVEYWYRKTFAARLGFKHQIGENDLETSNFFHRMTAGFGLRWADLQLDYGFATYADLGGTHRLMITLHYGPLSDKVENY
jgi:hypothetical protein